MKPGTSYVNGLSRRVRPYVESSAQGQCGG